LMRALKSGLNIYRPHKLGSGFSICNMQPYFNQTELDEI
jgi:hypothetical protein